jgi:branched-chain amino acid transport system ATP-binding protein
LAALKLDTPPPPALEVRGLRAGYGRGKVVLHGIDLTVGDGRLALIMGHNGAGKTTLLHTIFGALRPEAGEIRCWGRPLRGRSAERVRAGVSYTAGGRTVFAGLPVAENLAIAADVVGADAPTAARRRELVFHLFPDLRSRLGAPGGTLSGGQQRMLAIAMAVMQQPRLLLLDEPSLGLSPLLVERLYEGIAAIRRELGLSVLVVEQSINPSLLAPDEVYILRMGQVVFSGGADTLDDIERLWALF